MAKTKISEFSSTPANNTDIDSINIAEGCAPSGINDAIRELMAQLKDFQTGAAGDSFNGPVGTTTAAAGAFTTLTASSTATLNTLASSGATLTGGSINNMTIGGTTAAAVSATTLTTSGAVTLNGGTANGVAYLNGSKVLTTGSALTFDGTNLGVGTAPVALASQAAITIRGASISRVDMQGAAGAGGGAMLGSASVFKLQANYAIPLILDAGTTSHTAFTIGDSEKMRLTSTGLGIGTSSPTYKLDVNGGDIRITDTFPSLVLNGTTGGVVWNFIEVASGNLETRANDITRLSLTSSGNLGLGVAPSAWSAFKAFEISNAGNAIWSAGSNDVRISTNHIYNLGDKYVTTGRAAEYIQTAGTHQWYTAPSGTAGNAISFTQALTLTSTVNLLLGGTSDPGGSNCLYIANRGSVPGTPTGGGVIFVEAGALKYKGSSGTVTTLGAA